MKPKWAKLAHAGGCQALPNRSLTSTGGWPIVILVKRACWATLVALGALATSAKADREPSGAYRFRSFGSAEGLHNLVVIGITEDTSGYLWVGTDDGLYRWDGNRFSHVALEQGLPTTRVLAVGTGPDGAACAGTTLGLSCWREQRFVTAMGIPAAPVYAMANLGGRMWVGANDGLYVRSTDHPFARAPGWVGTGAVRAVYADARGLVVGDGARVLVSSGDGVWRSLDGIGLVGDRVDNVFRARDGALWIRTAFHVWRLAPGAARAEDLTAGVPRAYDVVGVAQSMVDGPGGEVWLGTDVGIARRIGDRWKLLDRSVGLPGPGARTLYVDRHGTTWVGAIGLYELRGRGLIERHDIGTGLPGDVAWSFARDRAGDLWIGTSHCLAHVVDRRWACLQGSENRVVRSFVFAPQGGVFLGGAPSNLLYIDPAGKVTTIAVGPTTSVEHMVLALRLDPEGDLWIASKAGLFRLRGAVPGPIERVVIPGVHPDARFSSLLVADGRLWSATPDGVVVLDRGAWRVFGVTNGFRATGMRYLVKSHGRRLCVAYMDAIGVSCFESDGTTIENVEHLGTAEGLGSGMVYFLGEDRQQRLWIGTGDGVDVVTTRGVEHFAASDGLAGDDSAGNSYFEDTDGSLWLGSTGGASHVYAQHYTGPQAAPSVLLREASLGDRAIPPTTTEPLVTTYDRNAFSLAFGTDTLTDATRVEYQVRLLPNERAWRTTHIPEEHYPALVPDRYTFEARARVGRGAWGRPLTVAFEVAPAWWQTRWFLAVACIAGLGAIGVAFAWRQRILLSRRTRQLNEEAAANVRALLEVVPDLITVYRDGELTYMNLAARRLWASDADGRDLAIHADDRPLRAEMLERAAAPDQPSKTYELRARDVDGGWRTCEVSCARLELSGATVLVVSGRDVTERNRLRAQLLVSDRMASLGTLAAGIGHEINNPLAYLIGNLEFLGELGVVRHDAEIGAAVDDAIDGAHRVRKIVQGLRSFSRSEGEARRLLDLGEVLRAATRLAANEIRHRAQLIWDLGPVPRVHADDGRLTQVFLNLIVNAAQAIPDGHSDENRITLRTSTDALGRAVVEIVDTGAGMSPEVLARAFDPFFTTKDVGVGTGLGLSICHGIIGSLGGEIAFESALGRGTTARVVLPAAPVVALASVDARSAPAPASAPAPVSAPAPASAPALASALAPAASGISARHRVMIVDDDPQVADMLARVLGREHDVVVAGCVDVALGHVKAGARFDVVISDVMMPNLTGIDLLEELVSIAPEQAQRLVFLSGGVFTPETRARLDQLGTRQLEKPITLKELRAVVASVIAAA